MATYSNLEIYKLTHKLVVTLTPIAVRLKHNYKFTYGDDIVNTTKELLLKIYDINAIQGQERLNEFKEFFRIYERLKQLLGILVELKIMDGKKLGPSFSMLGQIGKHGRKWWNYSKNYYNTGKKMPSVVKENDYTIKEDELF